MKGERRPVGRNRRTWRDDAADGKVGWTEAVVGSLLGDPSPSEERAEAERRRGINGGPYRGDAFRMGRK